MLHQQPAPATSATVQNGGAHGSTTLTQSQIAANIAANQQILRQRNRRSEIRPCGKPQGPYIYADGSSVSRKDQRGNRKDRPGVWFQPPGSIKSSQNTALLRGRRALQPGGWLYPCCSTGRFISTLSWIFLSTLYFYTTGWSGVSRFRPTSSRSGWGW